MLVNRRKIKIEDEIYFVDLYKNGTISIRDASDRPLSSIGELSATILAEYLQKANDDYLARFRWPENPVYVYVS